MNIVRVIIILSAGLISHLAYAQAELPSIISLILEEDGNTSVDLESELRFRQTIEFDDQTNEILSITTPNYDNFGRVESQVQQLFFDGEIESVNNTVIEYDVLGRAASASSVLTEVSDGLTTSIQITFTYFPLEFRLTEVVITSTGPDGAVGTINQQFEYDTVDRISQVVSVLPNPFGDILIIDIPSYSGSRISSVSRNINSASGNSTITTSLGYNATEHISTTINLGSTIIENNLSFTSGIQTTTRGFTGQRFRDVTEYENGICDSSNEQNRRLIGLFTIPNFGNGLGRQCR